MTAHEVSITRRAVISGSPEAVFAFITAEDVLPKVLTGYGPLPAVVRTSGHTGNWDIPGSARVVHLADGTSVREQLTHYVSPPSLPIACGMSATRSLKRWLPKHVVSGHLLLLLGVPRSFGPTSSRLKMP